MSTCAPNAVNSSPDMPAGVNGVQIGPGSTAFTRMPLSVKIPARPMVRLAPEPRTDA